ncbi:MAG: hypothetical protein LBC42_02385 [Puniceicoccales bacterium]|jgi:hypothetical protein|nr:hypothetical protein [Puniceicoccales bacterium]
MNALICRDGAGFIWRNDDACGRSGDVIVAECCLESGRCTVSILDDDISRHQLCLCFYEAPWRITDAVDLVITFRGVGCQTFRYTNEKFLGARWEMFRWFGFSVMGLGTSMLIPKTCEMVISSVCIFSEILPWIVAGIVLFSVGIIIIIIYNKKMCYVPACGIWRDEVIKAEEQRKKNSDEASAEVHS